MCGRFALHPTLTEAQQAYGIDRDAAAVLEASDDIRPTTEVATVLGGAERTARRMRWGFVPDWYAGPEDGPLIINARSETIAQKPAFAEACRQRRCLIPMSGFYEWQAVPGRGKRVHWLAPAEGGLHAFAGIWQVWCDEEGAARASCAIVTCAAPEALSHIHARLPVAILPEDYALWLGEAGHGAATLMRPPPDGWWEVTPDRGPPPERPRLL
ncbi:SOS response-associated peptidase [Roseobacter sp. HKCCA0434]|uniref:SOS response-associated peptidase n=1 Tax=Roseobacter sp. HKCCA0434 TaxID=3079297 RepID=UPI002905DCFF|nr:SOS response-associated peptidase [Roseobacter sp. HKCCA0434]